MVDASGTVLERYSYTPYGTPTVLHPNFSVNANGTAIGNTHLYTGRDRDPETGLYHYRTRPNAAHLGRFTTRDWIEYEGSQWNLYEYVLNRPVTLVDPTGLKCTLADSRIGP